MQGIRPQQLTNEELLCHAYIIGYGKLSPEWAEEICKRFEALLDIEDRYDEGYEAGRTDGYDDGYSQGANDATDDGK
jgi:hypothetical protein